MTENSALAERLTSSETRQEASLRLPLLKLLAQGDQLEISALAAAVGRSEADVQQALAAVPDIEYEYSRVIGRGLTLRPSPHRFEINGKQLHIWCALDTLIFPTLLGASARVESVSPQSGEPITVTVSPDGVQSVSPETAVVSLVNPEDMASIRSYRLGTEMARTMIENADQHTDPAATTGGAAEQSPFRGSRSLVSGPARSPAGSTERPKRYFETVRNAGENE